MISNVYLMLKIYKLHSLSRSKYNNSDIRYNKTHIKCISLTLKKKVFQMYPNGLVSWEDSIA